MWGNRLFWLSFGTLGIVWCEHGLKEVAISHMKREIRYIEEQLNYKQCSSSKSASSKRASVPASSSNKVIFFLPFPCSTTISYQNILHPITYLFFLSIITILLHMGDFSFRKKNNFFKQNNHLLLCYFLCLVNLFKKVKLTITCKNTQKSIFNK